MLLQARPKPALTLAGSPQFLTVSILRTGLQSKEYPEHESRAKSCL